MNSPDVLQELKISAWSMFALEPIPLWIFAITIVVLLVVSLEIGWIAGKARGPRNIKISGNITLAGILTLLGLLSSFTYAFALKRADANWDAITKQSNAIMTAFLRADLIDGEGRDALRNGLLAYVNAWATPVGMDDFEKLIKDIRILEKAESALWPISVRVTEALPPSTRMAVLRSINEILDSHMEVAVAARDRLPIPVFLLIVTVSASSLFAVGLVAGGEGALNRWIANTLLAILVGTILIILDFDRSWSGVIRFNNHALIATQEIIEQKMRLQP